MYKRLKVITAPTIEELETKTNEFLAGGTVYDVVVIKTWQEAERWVISIFYKVENPELRHPRP